jgi:hypothetical protein
MTPDDAYAALDPNREWGPFRLALTRSCPWCKARPGQPCTTKGGGIPLTQGTRVHPSRLEAP